LTCDFLDVRDRELALKQCANEIGVIRQQQQRGHTAIVGECDFAFVLLGLTSGAIVGRLGARARTRPGNGSDIHIETIEIEAVRGVLVIGMPAKACVLRRVPIHDTLSL
jgi:hypothetical protein